MSGEKVAGATRDWRSGQGYEYATRLSRHQWAWEFLRRNPEFIKDWDLAQREYALMAREGATTVMAAAADNLTLNRWGCLYASSPEHGALSASVMWKPDVSKEVLHAKAHLATANLDAAIFRMSENPVSSILLELPHGPQHVLFVEEGRGLQLAVEGEDILHPVRLAFGREGSVAQLHALLCFNDLRLSGRLYPAHFPSARFAQRLTRVLRALDGSLSGASHKDIALGFYGADYVAQQWNIPGNNLRDRVRRAVYRGHALMQKRYRDLL